MCPIDNFIVIDHVVVLVSWIIRVLEEPLCTK